MWMGPRWRKSRVPAFLTGIAQDPVHTQRQVETARRRLCLALLQGSVPVLVPGLMLQDQRDAELQPSLCRRDA